MTPAQARRLVDLRVDGEAPQPNHTASSRKCIEFGWAEDTGRRTKQFHQIDRITDEGLAALTAYEATVNKDEI